MFVEAMMRTGEFLFRRREFGLANVSSRSTSSHVAFIFIITHENLTKLYEKFAQKTTQLRFSSYFLRSKSLLFRYSVL